MEFLVTASNVVEFENKDLRKATQTIFKLGDSIKRNWFAIAYVVAGVAESECYKDDGFANVHEWVSKTFGIKKTASYSLLTIGKEYTRQIHNASGKVVGYGTNLLEDTDKDFSKTQVEKMLPAGHDKALELVKSGDITPDMSAKEISKVVKDKCKSETETDDVETDDAEMNDVESEQTTEESLKSVYDSEGNEYIIPVSVLEEYKVK